jgi:hypothetical protein
VVENSGIISSSAVKGYNSEQLKTEDPVFLTYPVFLRDKSTTQLLASKAHS